mgnify:CR=1 FL=1
MIIVHIGKSRLDCTKTELLAPVYSTCCKVLMLSSKLSPVTFGMDNESCGLNLLQWEQINQYSIVSN